MKTLRNAQLGVTLAALAAIGLTPVSNARAAGDGAGYTLSGGEVSLHSQYLNAVADLHTAGIATSLTEVFSVSAPDDQNAAPLYIKLRDYTATQAEADSLAVLGPSPTDADWAKARAFLAGNADLVALVHKAASMPDCVVPGRATAPDPAAILFPELAPIRRAEHIIAVESAVKAHDGNGVEAVKNAALGFQISGHAYQEPMLIGWLVGIAVDSITINNIDQIMVMDRADPAVVATADQALSGWHEHGIGASLSSETAFAVVEVGDLRHADAHALTQLAGGWSTVPPALKTASRSPAAWQDFIDSNGLAVLRYYKSIIAASAEPYPASSSDMAAIDADLGNQHGDDYTLAHILCPVFTKAINRQPMIEGRVALAQACAALLAYKQAHGEYPGALQQAMSTVPIDPFNLQQVQYRPDGGGFVLYCVGESGRYAGGSSSTSETVLRVSGAGGLSWK